jgi:hypothetical protein
MVPIISATVVQGTGVNAEIMINGAPYFFTVGRNLFINSNLPILSEYLFERNLPI